MLHTSVSKKIKEITRRDFITITGDAGCRKTLSAIFEKHAIDIVIHFAGFKSVSESKSEPLKYYQNNVGVTITLLQVMEEYRIKNLSLAHLRQSMVNQR